MPESQYTSQTSRMGLLVHVPLQLRLQSESRGALPPPPAGARPGARSGPRSESGALVRELGCVRTGQPVPWADFSAAEAQQQGSSGFKVDPTSAAASIL